MEFCHSPGYGVRPSLASGSALDVRIRDMPIYQTGARGIGYRRAPGEARATYLPVRTGAIEAYQLAGIGPSAPGAIPSNLRFRHAGLPIAAPAHGHVALGHTLCTLQDCEKRSAHDHVSSRSSAILRIERRWSRKLVASGFTASTVS
jgi:hypothetical protein